MHKIGFVLGTGTRNIAKLMMCWCVENGYSLGSQPKCSYLLELFISKHLFYYDTISVLQ